ncbi:tRNA pseudouridine synthase D [Thermoplasmatales archaeon SG8-52-4]|nr:MAG: tRNA pseudouridine synthase D [Thermoplasmatales archaeon SG8-52-4]
MKVLDVEKKIGIETFFTPFKGIGGKLRTTPEEFIVNEISNYPPKKENGKFTIADVTSNNWETNHLIRELSKNLHISRKRIGFAGTKDKRANTTQLMSFYKITIDELSKIKIKDIEIENIYTSDRPVKIGNLVGNRFLITVRNIDKKVSSDSISDIVTFIEKYGGFPNFYGVQRFGIIRPITHVVGKYIVRNNFKKAVMTYIANPIEGEDEESFGLRKSLENNLDFATALKLYPDKLDFEKAILNKLVQNPNDFVSALKELPKNLLTMFIYAYQSYLFNRILSERIKKKIPLNKAVLGDIILPIRNRIIDQDFIRVTENNIEKINKQISKKKAVVSGVLFGSDSVFSEGDMGEIEHKIIDNEKIDPRDFIIPEIPFISSSGSRHPLLAYIDDIKFEVIVDDLKIDKKAIILNFKLQKGCYATSLLREFMKTADIRNY